MSNAVFSQRPMRELARVIIAGGRDFNDCPLLKRKCDRILSNIKKRSPIEIVSGMARGADTLGDRYAKECGYAIAEFPADWDKHGKSAGHKRNAQMGIYATHCIVFWDGRSKDTRHMIAIAERLELGLRIIRY